MTLERVYKDNDFNAEDYSRETALHYAVRNGHYGVVAYLLEKHASVHALNSKQQTVLHLAAEIGDLKILELLLTKKPDLMAKDVTGITAKGSAQKERKILQKEESLDEAKVSMLTKVIDMLEAAQFSDLKLARNSNPVFAEADKFFKASVTHFLPNDSVVSSNLSMDTLMNEDRAKNWFETNKGKLDRGGYRWFHLPANNMTWVEILMLQCEKYGGGPERDKLLNKQFWAGQKHEGMTNPHGRFMRPFCERISTGNKNDSLVLYMPYIHWETEEKALGIKRFLENLESQPPETEKLKLFIKAYLSKENLKSYNPLHLRRTFDQYCYYTLESTFDRDRDQLLSRVFRSQQSKSHQIAIDKKLFDNFQPHKPILMVDQLWLWTLDNNTVISCFPERWSHLNLEGHADGPTDDPEPHGRTDVFKNVNRNSHNVKSVPEMVELIIEECTRACFDDTRYLDTFFDILEIYKDEVDRITNEEAICFRRFSLGVRSLEGSKLNRMISDEEDFLNISEEIKLVREIKDIRDELHTMGVIFEHQSQVVHKLGCAWSVETDMASSPVNSLKTSISPQKTYRLVQECLNEVKDIDKHAEDAYTALNNLLDLKQKIANVAEARWSRGQAEETAKQGSTILVFTVVTIVFLPLSFMAAFFALDVTEFPKDPSGSLHLDFVTKYIFSISAAVVIPLLLLAFNVNQTTKTYDNLSERLRKKSIQFSNNKTSEAGMDRKKHPRVPKIQFLKDLVLYLFLILPISEVRFSCKLLKKGSLTTEHKSGDQHEQSPGSRINTNINSFGQGWKLRNVVKDSMAGIFAIARVLVIPIWVSLLCAEVAALLILSLIVCLPFEVDPWRDINSWLKSTDLFSLR